MQELYAQLAALLGILATLLAAPVPFEEPPHTAATTTAAVVRVIDGDTIDVEIAGEHERVRYIGIDAPEAAHGTAAAECYAAAATAANEALVGGETVGLVADTTDRDDYNRLLRYVYVGDVLVNEQLVARGAATVLSIPPNTAHWKRFKDAADTARAEDRGLWKTCK